MSRKKISVGALMTRDDGTVLLVDPVYKDRWDLPGGILEDGEDPVTGLVREVREELGVACIVGAVRCLDYGASDWEGAEVVMMTFAASLADPDRGFDLQASEIREARWFTPEEALTLVTPRMRDRLEVALERVPVGRHGILVDRSAQRSAPA